MKKSNAFALLLIVLIVVHYNFIYFDNRVVAYVKALAAVVADF